MKRLSTHSHSLKAAPQTWRTAFAWQNYALTCIAVILIVVGFTMMLPEIDVRNTPGGRYAPAPGPGAFDARRIRAAPIPCFIGFVLMVPAIMYVPRERIKEDEKVLKV